MANSILSFSACGLYYDVAGALLLGFAFFFKSKEQIINEAGINWDSDPHVLRNIASTKLDGTLGTVLLFIGFIYQILGITMVSNSHITIISYILLVFIIFLYFVCYRKIIVNKWCAELEEKINNK